MKRIDVEKSHFIYFSKSDGLPDTDEIKNLPTAEIWEKVISPNMVDFRLIGLQMPQFPHQTVGEFVAYFLYWSNNEDLDDLDKKVDTGKHSDTDFTYSVRTVLQRTKCFNCGWEGYTLVFPSADGYLGNAALEDEKVNQLMSQNGFLKCPSCEQNFRQRVVKILENTI